MAVVKKQTEKNMRYVENYYNHTLRNNFLSLFTQAPKLVQLLESQNAQIEIFEDKMFENDTVKKKKEKSIK